MINWENKLMNLGDVETGSTNNTSFTFEEDSNIEIVEVKAACGCTAPRIKGNTVKVTYYARNDIPAHLREQGFVNVLKSVTVRYRIVSTNETKEDTLHIKARVVPKNRKL